MCGKPSVKSGQAKRRNGINHAADNGISVLSGCFIHEETVSELLPSVELFKYSSLRDYVHTCLERNTRMLDKSHRHIFQDALKVLVTVTAATA